MASCLGEPETSAGHTKTKAHALQRLISIESEIKMQMCPCWEREYFKF